MGPELPILGGTRSLKQRSRSLAEFAAVNIRHHTALTDSAAPHLLG